MSRMRDTMKRLKSSDRPNALSGLTGSVTALATPFLNGDVDLEAVGLLCERQVRGGTAAIVVCGSTGEGPSLTDEEQGAIVAAAVEAVGPALPIIAGCNAGCTAGAARLAGIALRNGAAGLLCSPPPYVKPTQEGIATHIRAITFAADLPIMLYDIPGRVGVAIEDETIARLFEAGFIAAVKDATANLARPPRLRALCGPNLVQMTGDDGTAAAYRAMGGQGCVSVTANVVPALCAQMHDAWDRGEHESMGRIRDLLAPLHDALFAESNPIPLKAALFALRLCSGELRLPLTRAATATRDRLATVLAGVLAAEKAAVDRAAHRPPAVRPSLTVVH